MHDSSMKNMKKTIQKSEELLPSQKFMVKWKVEKSFSFSSFNLQTFSKTRDWVTTPKLLQNAYKYDP